MKSIYKREGETIQKLDSLFNLYGAGHFDWARLGHVIFYQPNSLRKISFGIPPFLVLKGGIHFTRFRGLASHGAAIGHHCHVPLQ